MVKKVNEETGEEEEVEEEKTKMVPKQVSKEVEVDENKLLEILGAAADFEEVLEKGLKKKENFALLVGEDLYNHPNSQNLARLVALVEKYTDFTVTITPAKTNSLGVALICDLDESTAGYTVGYNVKADFTLSALGNGDLDIPALNQQEGTFTSANQMVVPTNAALAYEGYVLNDIANEILDTKQVHTINRTVSLGAKDGFKAINFDELPNHFSNSGEELRGYTLESLMVKTSGSETVIPFGTALEGTLIYSADPVLQFNDFTAKTKQLNAQGGLFISTALAESLSVSQGDSCSVEANGQTMTLAVTVDSKIDGEIAFVSRFDSSIPTAKLFNGYRFNQAKISKV
ncbi:MAG: ferredoxin, partial [Thiovulaceae bacterium]|nr:ferredoxin [Sulfurimonadaceae bacterium]